MLKKATLRTAAVIAVFGNRTAVLVTVLLLPHRHPEPKAKDLDLLSIDYEPIIGELLTKNRSGRARVILSEKFFDIDNADGGIITC